MQCPLGDGELISHTTQGEQNLTVSYSTCPTCHGYWMESFAANFIKLPHPLTPERSDGGRAAYCPICQKQLERATGENIPDTVWIFKCQDGHGYFFPTGQLAAFKRAQKTKLEYHKLWHLPLPSVASVLLTSLLILVLAGGLIAGFLAVQNNQTTSSQARALLISEHTYVTPNTHDVLFTAQTQDDATLTVHIPLFNNFEKELDSKDHLTHTLIVKSIPSGSYQYYYSIQIGNNEVSSDMFSFEIPE